MADVLAPLGYAPAEAPAEADMVILNTCHIREKAAEKVFSELGRLRQAREGRRREAGERHDHRGRRLRRPGRGRGDPAPRAVRRHRARAADLSPPAGDGGARARAQREGRHGRRGAGVLDTEFPAGIQIRPPAGAVSADQASPPSSRCRKAATSSAPSASCPIRAARSSRAPCRRSSPRRGALVAAGAREITLLGQNVNAYHGEAPRLGGPTWGLGRLIRAAGRSSMACCASATPPRIRATWTTT